MMCGRSEEKTPVVEANDSGNGVMGAEVDKMSLTASPECDGRDSPLITTFIPTFRHPRLLRRAIKSVLAQTFRNFKLCVYDNNSGDETASVVAEFARKDSRVFYHCHESNIGGFANFQYGLAQVESPFFSILSDDDVLLPEFYEVAMEGFEKYSDAMLSATDVFIVGSKGEIIHDSLGKITSGFYEPGNGLMEMVENGFAIWTGSLFRRDVRRIVDLFGTDVGMLGDWDYLCQISAACPVVLNSRPGALLYNESQRYAPQTKVQLRQMIANLTIRNLAPEKMGRIEASMIRRYQRKYFLQCLYFLERMDLRYAPGIVRNLCEAPGNALRDNALSVVVNNSHLRGLLCEVLRPLGVVQKCASRIAKCMRRGSSTPIFSEYFPAKPLQEQADLKFSIVIPVFDGEKDLKRCMKSILSQTHENFEVVFVDDGSIDKSTEIIESFKDPHVRLIRQSRKGVLAARILGVRESVNPLIAFLCLEDEWLPDHLATLAFLFTEYERGGIYCTGFREECEGGAARTEVFVDAGEGRYSLVRDPFRLLCVQEIFNTSNTAVLKNVLEDVGFFSELEGKEEEGVPWSRLAARLPLVASPLVTSVRHQGSKDQKANFCKRREGVLARLRAAQNILDEEMSFTLNPRSLREYMGHLFAVLFWEHVAENEREELKKLFKSLRGKSLAPIYYWLAHAPLSWRFLRLCARVRKFCRVPGRP